jgi:hypothetical protein
MVLVGGVATMCLVAIKTLDTRRSTVVVFTIHHINPSTLSFN